MIQSGSGKLTASFQFLLFNVTPLFLEAMVGNMEILKKKS